MDAWIELAIASHKSNAKQGTWDGRAPNPYFERCRQQHLFAGVSSLFTRDVGYHSSGWWKNPDYERCYHLSLSFFDPVTLEPDTKNESITKHFIDGLFGEHKQWVWCEPPYSQHGKKHGVHHYRLFCDAGWQPIKPRGEVYSRELTEAGWHSYSGVREALQQTGANPNLPQ